MPRTKHGKIKTLDDLDAFDFDDDGDDVFDFDDDEDMFSELEMIASGKPMNGRGTSGAGDRGTNERSDYSIDAGIDFSDSTKSPYAELIDTGASDAAQFDYDDYDSDGDDDGTSDTNGTSGPGVSSSQPVRHDDGHVGQRIEDGHQADRRDDGIATPNRGGLSYGDAVDTPEATEAPAPDVPQPRIDATTAHQADVEPTVSSDTASNAQAPQASGSTRAGRNKSSRPPKMTSKMAAEIDESMSADIDEELADNEEPNGDVNSDTLFADEVPVDGSPYRYGTDVESADDEQQPEFVKKNAEFYGNYAYSDVPKLPQQFRSADIIGLRTRATGKNEEKIGTITQKKRLRKLWDDMTDVEKYILMLISEHRHLTVNQLQTLIILPTQIRKANAADMRRMRGDARTDIPVHNTLKPYFSYVTSEKYKTQLSYKECHKTATVRGLMTILRRLQKLELIEEITPSYKVKPASSQAYKDTPSLFTEHYYLTVMGARLLICNTAATQPSGDTPVGFVPTYKDSSYLSIVHETECAECFLSIMSCSEYASNMELFNPDADDYADYGFFDICRFFHEKDVEARFRLTDKDRETVFKSDGELTLYSSRLGDFIDYFLEYDAGSSKPYNIKHKIAAFAKYVLYLRKTVGETARRPVLLLVTQKPSSFMPSLNQSKSQGTVYTRGIQTLMRTTFKDMIDQINDIACVLVTDCNAIRQHGAMGACWHRMDLRTGKSDDRALDLIEASKSVVSG